MRNNEDRSTSIRIFRELRDVSSTTLELQYQLLVLVNYNHVEAAITGCAQPLANLENIPLPHLRCDFHCCIQFAICRRHHHSVQVKIRPLQQSQ
jgi:hypothetical protein